MRIPRKLNEKQYPFQSPNSPFTYALPNPSENLPLRREIIQPYYFSDISREILLRFRIFRRRRRSVEGGNGESTRGYVCVSGTYVPPPRGPWECGVAGRSRSNIGGVPWDFLVGKRSRTLEVD